MIIDINKLSSKIIGAAIEVHKALGPGLLESAYEECLCYELSHGRLSLERQKPLALQYNMIKRIMIHRKGAKIAKKILTQRSLRLCGEKISYQIEGLKDWGFVNS